MVRFDGVVCHEIGEVFAVRLTPLMRPGGILAEEKNMIKLNRITLPNPSASNREVTDDVTLIIGPWNHAGVQHARFFPRGVRVVWMG